MIANWSQSEDSSKDEDEKEVANMCFMAFDNHDEVNSSSNSDCEDVIDYEELLNDINNLHKKNVLLKGKILELQKELKEVNTKFVNFEASKFSLEKKNEELIKEASYTNEKFFSYESSKIELEKKNEELLNEINILKTSSSDTSSLELEKKNEELLWNLTL